jgi:hypothetical protein
VYHELQFGEANNCISGSSAHCSRYPLSVQVFELCLVFFFGTCHLTVRPPYQECKSNGWPNDRDVEPMRDPGSWAPPHTIGPPTGPQQIVSLPRFNTSMCSLQVSHESSTTTRYLTTKRRGSKNPGSFLLHVNARSPVLSGLTNNPSLYITFLQYEGPIV